MGRLPVGDVTICGAAVNVLLDGGLAFNGRALNGSPLVAVKRLC